MKARYTKRWVCTDPDTKQYGRQLSHLMFEFKEGNKRAIVNLGEYGNEEIAEHLSSYGYSLEVASEFNIYDMYGKETNWIIAECIFEQTNN